MDLKSFGELNYLSVKNLRAIDLVQMTLKNGSFVPLYGPNGSGKSTVLDALMLLFKGGAVPNEIIKDGGNEAEIVAKTSSGITLRKRIHKTKSGKQTTELVMQKDNKAIAAPQAILKDLFGGFITPNKIAESSGAALYKNIVSFMSCNFDYLEDDILNKKEALATTNMAIKLLGVVDAPVGSRPEVTKYIKAEHDAAKKVVTDCETHLTLRAQTKQLVADLEIEIEEKKARLKELNMKLIRQNNIIIDETQLLGNAKGSVKSFDDVLENQELSSKWVKYDEYLIKSKELNDSALTQKSLVKESIENLTSAYSNADTKVLGLEVTADKSVLFNGLPWENACFSDKMKVAAQLSIMNKDDDKLPIMFIEHGESLSVAKRNEIAKIAIEKGAIVFIEVFMEDTSGVEDGVVMSLPEIGYIPCENTIDMQTEGKLDIIIEPDTVEAKENALEALGLIKGAPVKNKIDTSEEEIWD